MIGNGDLNMLGMGTPEETDREVQELIRHLGPGGACMISSGNSLAFLPEARMRPGHGRSDQETREIPDLSGLKRLPLDGPYDTG